MEGYSGWEGSAEWKVEVTAGTAVVPDAAFGLVKNVRGTVDAGLEPEHSVGIWTPVSLEEGVIEVGGSCEFLPVTAAATLIGKRSGSTGRLSSYSIHMADGANGITFTGAKINSITGRINAGGRLSHSLDWMALSAADASRITPVIPTEVDIWGWHEVAHSLSGECDSIEWTINHNLRRRPVIPGSGSTAPVTGVNRAPYRIQEGVENVQMTLAWIARPSQSVVADLITELASVVLTATGDGSGTHVLRWTFSNGKPKTRSPQLAPESDSQWTMDILFKSWNLEYDPA